MEDFGPETAGCLICRGAEGDDELRRVLVWEDHLWRLTMSLYSEIPGFSYSEPKRHIPHITDLDGPEARTLGVVLGRAASVLREATRSDLVYLYVFGGTIPHLHFHLAPHVRDDALNAEILRREAQLIPPNELWALATRVRETMAASTT